MHPVNRREQMPCRAEKNESRILPFYAAVCFRGKMFSSAWPLYLRLVFIG